MKKIKYYYWRLLNPIISCTICTLPSHLPICTTCKHELNVIESVRCKICAKTGHELCKSCINEARYFSHTYAKYCYQTPLSQLLHKLKYKKEHAVHIALGYLLNEILTNIKPDTDFILPMPIHKNRRLQRGFNQTEILLDYFITHNSLKIPVVYKVAQKLNDTPHQTLIKRLDKNLIPLFKVSHYVQNKNVLIVDDVLTSGNSANELAKALKQAGAKRVEVCVLMRT